MYKYILFDFDGTLIDTNELITLTLNETSLKYLHHSLSTDKLNSILGKPLEEQMKCLSSEHWPSMVEYYKEFYRSHQKALTKEFPQIDIMLQKLKDLGCKNAIVSAKGISGILHGLEHFDYKKYIDYIVSAYDVQNNKPHPEPALKALAHFRAEKKEVLLVGDSPYDILCGKNAGIKTVLVNWTIFPKSQFINFEPDYVINTPLDLLKIVEESS
uniref:HAD-IA family hydrolase n=1 Tax=Acetivibrio cellulolyticus TaxID=35830 RepID=UPI0002481C20|nr:HAD-IA family hydrolase [Acetivibrio cellulolyticus]